MTVPPTTATSMAHRGQQRWHPQRWSLRSRLTVALIGLLAITVIAIGVITVVSLNQFLVGQLDDQLLSATSRAQASFDRDPDDIRSREPQHSPDFLVAAGQATGTLGAVVRNGQVVRAAVLDSRGIPQPIPVSAASNSALSNPSSEPTTVNLGALLGEYRVVGVAAPDGSVLVAGLPMASVEQTVQRLALIIGVVAIIGLLAAAGAAIVIISYSLRPLRRVAATATTVAQLPLDTGEVALAVRVPGRDTDPYTEVGQVGAAINHMLENVAAALTARQASEMRVRSFVADASHELRTPLASIRGYAELTRRSESQMPPDAVYALDRIESESLRMTSLVEDLLLLARLDSGRPIEFHEVDVSATLVTCVRDAHVAGPDHVWDLKIPEEPVTVVGDAGRIQQVIANLLTNARVHTPEGTRVTASLSISTIEYPETVLRRWAQVQIHDNGPGIPGNLLPDVFERFSRGDSSRSRTAGSSGLGLAIATAVVGAHHGSISVESTPGSTTFTLLLPAGWS